MLEENGMKESKKPFIFTNYKFSTPIVYVFIGYSVRISEHKGCKNRIAGDGR